MPYRLAIIEDNAAARSALRSHLLPMGHFEISSFSNGNELKSALRLQNFEILLIDFHLGQGKNGVEWLQELHQGHFIKPSTGIFFITADRLPQTIGRIIDIFPDLLLIKPYNIITLTRNVAHYLAYRRYVSHVLTAMDDNDTAEAIRQVEKLDGPDTPPKLKNDILKLHARLLFQSGQLLQAKSLYESVLIQSEKVLWAQWGKIKCEYLAGNWADCKHELSALLTNNLAREKAFEWLACLCFEQQAWAQAEFYLDHIKVSELSVPATRLKSLTYQKQDKVLEGIELLQKKRDYNRSTRERFNEFTFELAEFYLSIAEHQPLSNRYESLNQARRLIGIAGRNQSDPQLQQKKDYLLAYSAVLENAHDKAQHFLDAAHMEAFLRTDPGTLIVAAKIHSSLGHSEKSKTLLTLAHERNQENLELSSQTLNEEVLINAERKMGIADQRALELNDTGTRLFLSRDYVQAMYYFYQAFQLMPATPAFGLNILQCMLESRHHSYRTFTVKNLLTRMTAMALSPANRKRLKQLSKIAEKEADYYLTASELTAPPQTDEKETATDSDESVN